MLDSLALLLAAAHFGVPLTYYWYAKTRWLTGPWKIQVDTNFTPNIAIIVPTYREGEFIERRLTNIMEQDYPKDKLEVIVVDSISDDATADIVKNWIRRNPDTRIRLTVDSERKGKMHALHLGLQEMSGREEVVVFTDADAVWERKALSKAVSYLCDQTVGVVTGTIAYAENSGVIGEGVYRGFYNTLRIAESKRHSTPVHNGPFQAVRTKLIREVGMPSFEGSEDSAIASFAAFAGYRAIQADDVMLQEFVRGSQMRRKVRRAQHLILNFLRTKGYAKRIRHFVKSPFETIWRIEWYMHIINPWLLMASILTFLAAAASHSTIAIASLMIGLLLLAAKPYRVWVLQQTYLLIAQLMTLRTQEVAWGR